MKRRRGILWLLAGLILAVLAAGISYFAFQQVVGEQANAVEEVPEEEIEQLNSGDWAMYRQEKEDLVNSLSASDWEPNLTTLDEVIGSLQFGDYGQ